MSKQHVTPNTSIDEELDRMNTASEAAQQAYWDTIAKHYPEINPRPLSREEEFAFDRSCLCALQQWLNTSKASS